jgi:hypothetical protein
MGEFIDEPTRQIPVLLEADVLVAGGGVAGCAAAVGAARAGARTVLLERNGCLGGVATASYMASIGNRFLLASGRRVIHGFAGEFVDRLVTAGAASDRWEHRDVPGCCFDSERLKVILIEWLAEAGVQVLTHALAARPIGHAEKLRGVFVESKSGRQAVLAKAVVDATGEADLAAQAGAETTMPGGTASILFKIANVDLDRFVDFLLADPDGFPAEMDTVKDAETFGRNWGERGVLFFPHGGGKRWRWLQQLGGLDDERGPAVGLQALGMYAVAGTGTVVINSNFYRVKELDVRTLSEFELHAQRMCYYVGEFLIRNVPGFAGGHICAMGSDLGVRRSRMIAGRSMLRIEHLKDPDEPFLADDVIGVTPAQDSRRAGGEFYKDFTTDVPFGVMVPTAPANLLVGSAKSICTEPVGIIRGMTGCMICGQAAGVASALAARQGAATAEVPIREIQRALLAQGAYLGDAARLESLGLR